MSQDETHDLISRIKAVAADLGKIPTKTEFISHPEGMSDMKLRRIIGTFSTLLQAAGMPTHREVEKKIDKSIFEIPVERQLERFKPSEPVKKESWKRTLFVGDAHHPWADWPTIESICRFSSIHKPEIIIQGGDLFDQTAHSRFPKSMNSYLPKDEHRIGREHAEKMWKMLQTTSPTAKCYQLWGNHDTAPLRRILEVMPAMEDWIEKIMTELMTFPGVETIQDYRTELILPGPVQVLHGYRGKLGDHRDYANMDTVAFHSHKGGVVFKQIHGSVRFELNAGYCGNAQSKGLSWTPQKITDWTKGWGWLDEWGPRFCPA